MRFKSFKVIGITFLIAVLFIAYQVYRENSRPFQALPERIENFEALDVDGGKTDFKTHKGKVTLIVLSASWCPACIAELPTLENDVENEVFVYQNGDDIIVSGNGELKVFDVLGRFVIAQHINGVQRVEKPSATGVYIFMMNGMTQKIVVR